MDGVKVGKRRAHAIDAEDATQNRRKRKREVEVEHSDSVQIVGESHVPVENHVQARLTACLDDSDDRMDRMGYVQIWINSIPEDVPLYVQTSHNSMVQINKGDMFPDEDDISSSEETPNQSPSAPSATPTGLTPSEASLAGLASKSTSNGVRVPNSGPNGVRVPNAVAAQAALNALRMLGGNPATTSTADHASWSRAFPSAQQQQPFTFPMQPTTDAAHLRSGIPQTGRLFDDSETSLVVKLFQDYFAKGSCPSLHEVRMRIESTPLAQNRTPTSVRAKIKRLQTSGRWTDYGAGGL